MRQYGRAGLIDTLGRWIVPPDRYTYLRYYGHTDPHRESDLRADPLLLFEGLDSDDSRGGWYAPLLDDSVLLVQRQGVYGLAGSRTGRELIAPCFDEPPAQLVGGVRGTRRGKPWLATLTGLSQPYDPSQPLPPGLSVYDSRAAELSNFFQTKEGYKTRHGRALWKD